MGRPDDDGARLELVDRVHEVLQGRGLTGWVSISLPDQRAKVVIPPQEEPAGLRDEVRRVVGHDWTIAVEFGTGSPTVFQADESDA